MDGRAANGRFVEVRLQPTPEGGWVATHSDVTAAAERISLQTLIDLVPDNLWVKDTAEPLRHRQQCDRAPDRPRGGAAI